jgi:hypothetical protein
MDLTKKRYDISYDTDETVTTEDTGYYTGTVSAGTVHPSYPPTYSNVTITSTGATTSPIYVTGTGISSPWLSTSTIAGTNSTKISLDGADADIVINGHSLTDTLRVLEERLNMLVPNPELEKEWAELKKLGDAYRKLEQDLTEKAAMWKALKAEDR